MPTITFKVSPAEARALRASAHAAKTTLSGYLRRKALPATKAECGGFVVEAPSPRLAAWATSAGRTTDAYLAQLAATHGLTLATFDRHIPASTFIA